MAQTVTISTITLDVSESKRLLQRASGVADIAISGTMPNDPANAGDKVVAKVVNYSDLSDLTPAFSEQTIETFSGAETTWSGTLSNVPEGGWYSVEVRLLTSGDAELDTASSKTDNSEKLGCGDWIGVIGQSNTARLFNHLYSASSLSPNDLSCKVVTGTDTVEDLVGDVDDGIVEFADRFITAESIPVGFLCYAIGASYLETLGGATAWLPNTGSTYTDFSDAVSYVGGCSAVIWYQGEQDVSLWTPWASSTVYSDSIETGSKYYANMQTLVSNLKTTCGSGVAFIICMLGRRNGDLSGSTVWPTVERWQEINNALKQIVADEANAYRFDTYHYERNDDGGGVYVHLTKAGYAQFGDELAYQYLNHLDSSTYPLVKPEIQTFNPISATQTEVYVSMTGLTPTSGLDCFKVFDFDGTEYAVSTATYSGSTVTLTHASCDKARVIRYAWGNLPEATPATTAPTVLKSASGSGSIDWPLLWDDDVTHELVTKLGSKWVNTKEEHNHWNSDALNQTTEPYTYYSEQTLNNLRPIEDLADYVTVNTVDGRLEYFDATGAGLPINTAELWSYQKVESTITSGYSRLQYNYLDMNPTGASTANAVAYTSAVFKKDAFDNTAAIPGFVGFQSSALNDSAGDIDFLTGYDSTVFNSGAGTTVNGLALRTRAGVSVGTMTNFIHHFGADSQGATNQYGYFQEHMDNSGDGYFLYLSSTEGLDPIGSSLFEVDGKTGNTAIAGTLGVTGTITGTLSGSASSVTTAVTSANCHIPLIEGTSSPQAIKYNSFLTFNASTALLSTASLQLSNNIKNNGGTNVVALNGSGFNIIGGQFYVGGTQVTSSASELNILDATTNPTITAVNLNSLTDGSAITGTDNLHYHSEVYRLTLSSGTGNQSITASTFDTVAFDEEDLDHPDYSIGNGTPATSKTGSIVVANAGTYMVGFTCRLHDTASASTTVNTTSVFIRVNDANQNYERFPCSLLEGGYMTLSGVIPKVIASDDDSISMVVFTSSSNCDVERVGTTLWVQRIA